MVMDSPLMGMVSYATVPSTLADATIITVEDAAFRSGKSFEAGPAGACSCVFVVNVKRLAQYSCT